MITFLTIQRLQGLLSLIITQYDIANTCCFWFVFNTHRSQLLSLNNRLFTKHCGRYVTFQQKKFNCNNCQRFPLGCAAALTVAALDWLNPTERLISLTFANLIGESAERGGLWLHNPEIHRGPLRLHCHVTQDWLERSTVPSEKKWVNITLFWLMWHYVCNILTWSLTLFIYPIRSCIWSNTNRLLILPFKNNVRCM